MYLIAERAAEREARSLLLSSLAKNMAELGSTRAERLESASVGSRSTEAASQAKSLTDQRHARLVDETARAFAPGCYAAASRYSPSMSVTSGAYSRRDNELIAEATLLGRQRQDTSGQTEIDHGSPLLDGLALNLLTSELIRYRTRSLDDSIRLLNPPGKLLPWAKSGTLNNAEFIAMLNSRKHWLESYWFTEAISTMRFSLGGASIRPWHFKLLVTARVTDGAITELIEAEAVDSKRADLALAASMTTVFKDQIRRNELVALYGKDLQKTRYASLLEKARTKDSIDVIKKELDSAYAIREELKNILSKAPNRRGW